MEPLSILLRIITDHSWSRHAALKETFNYVPDKFIHDTLKEQGHYYGTFFAILEAQRELSSARRPPFTLLKNRRASSNPSSSALMEQLRQDGYDFDALVKEIESAKQRRIREDGESNSQGLLVSHTRLFFGYLKILENIFGCIIRVLGALLWRLTGYSTAKRKAEKEIAEAEVAKDQEHRRKGDLIECGCCFDEVVIPKVTHCNGDEPHFFCLECARNNANNDIGNSRYQLHCMDGSGCRATFSREQRNRFLDSKTTEKLERLQQQNEIRLAELPNLSNCPFCDFAAICPPVDVDKEFHCHNPDCEEVSCRLCKLKSHIPLTCEEFKKEQGVSERRVIEEARTEALIRTCGKCKVRILKEDGCNKVVCTSCHAILCDYCGQDISKAMYNHFDGQGRAPPGLVVNAGGKCPLYDESNKRKDQQVERAEEDATAKVRAEHPELSAEDLKIKFAKSVQSSSDRHHNSHHARANQNLPPLNHPRDYMFYPGANPPAANVLGRYELEAMEVHNKRRHLAHAVRDYEDVQHMAQRQRNVNQHRHVVDLDPTTVLNNQLPPRPRRRHAVADPNNYIPERTYDDHAFGIH